MAKQTGSLKNRAPAVLTSVTKEDWLLQQPAGEVNKEREPIPEGLQFTIPNFAGIRPLTGSGDWANSLKIIDSFPRIAVHNS